MVGVDRLTRFTYFKWDPKFAHVKPYVLLMDKPAGHHGFPETNFDVETGPNEVVVDMRGSEVEFSLDQHGFAVRKSGWPLGVELPLVGDAEGLVQDWYLPAMQRMLEDEFGDAVETFFFDWRLRSNNPVQTELDIGMTVDLTDATLRLTPLKLVHVDQSPQGAINRVLHHMGDRASDLLKGRVRVINLWRPLVESVQDCPLAVCDGSSVPMANCLTADFVRKHYVGESMYPLPGGGHYRWHYLSRQTKDEVLMLKMYDSDQDVPARYCPHAAFSISDHPAGAAPRESIEVRALVFGP